MDLSYLNEQFQILSPENRLKRLADHFDSDEVLFTSSFGTTSVVLLDLVAKTRPFQKVHFINTGYLFAETLAYKNELRDMLNLEVIELAPDAKNHQFTSSDQTWEKDPDLCCTVNKLMPLEAIKPGFRLWMSGLLGYQNAFRSVKNIFEYEGDIIKFYPLIDLSPVQLKSYILQNRLPQHPLIKNGFGSVGCTHCTAAGCGREGRWNGKVKTECGLHSGQVKKAS